MRPSAMVDCCWPVAGVIKLVLIRSCCVGKLGTASQSKRNEFSSETETNVFVNNVIYRNQ